MRHALVVLALGAALAAPATAQTYTNGKIDDLPKAAWNLLNFSAVDLYTVEDNVDRMCGKNEYAGSGLFPGAIIVGNPDRFGRVRITWKVPGCAAMLFRISRDGNHVETLNAAAEAAMTP